MIGFARQAAPVRKKVAAWVAVAALALVPLTLISPGMAGVHRWIRLGPIGLNASAAASPWVLAAIPRWLRRAPGLAIAGSLAMLGLHLAQPDAAQATAFGSALVALIVMSSALSRAVRWGSVAAIVAAVSLTWMRPDPLLPVDHVERILSLAASLGPLPAMAAWLALALLFLPMARACRQPAEEGRALGLAFCLYLIAQIAITFAGHFPVPVMGAGAGPVLGWYAVLVACAPYLGGAVHAGSAGKTSSVGPRGSTTYALPLASATALRARSAVGAVASTVG